MILRHAPHSFAFCSCSFFLLLSNAVSAKPDAETSLVGDLCSPRCSVHPQRRGRSIGGLWPECADLRCRREPLEGNRRATRGPHQAVWQRHRLVIAADNIG